MTFDEAFDRVIGLEGGYVNDPADPGGETNWGISRRAYPTLDIKGLTREVAKGIYRVDFWSRLHADLLPDGVAFRVFDFGVNAGIETAVRKLQTAVGAADDGHWGPVSQARANLLSESQIIMRFLAEEIRYKTRLKNWKDAGRGWANRWAADLEWAAEDVKEI